ncbi:uncharacterized protein BJ171DRAFT_492216 [Polychytrium aggregatum]|uniref:uncharacterized protein n=1 Tax=Polychytrium aggregatum TaxID=110093 RepID=UPI0022FDDB97|nr:uncharacterized protein BJ171DRAFT_492216 [Polychytrium aggregatum]KAI9207951.1 hypothetical protein BJ171DRAFT_492216 [Polychytrium aggregatum]
MAAAIPINPSSIQWVSHYQSNRTPPQCAPSASSAVNVINNLGDFLIASNRCTCSPATGSVPSSCQYISVVPANSSIFANDCGQDPTCKKSCRVVGQYSTTNPNPCSTNFLSGAFSSLDFTTTALWDSSFKTKYFAYTTFSLNDASCSTVVDVNRTSVYPTCTQIKTGLYSITLKNTALNRLEFYACSDSACSACQMASSLSISSACSLDSKDSGTYFSIYLRGSLLSDPSLALKSSLPTRTTTQSSKPSRTSSPDPSPTPGPASNGALIGGIVGGVVAVAVLAIGLFAWTRARSKKTQPQAERAAAALPSPAAPSPPDQSLDTRDGPVSLQAHAQYSAPVEPLPVQAPASRFSEAPYSSGIRYAPGPQYPPAASYPNSPGLPQDPRYSQHYPPDSGYSTNPAYSPAASYPPAQPYYPNHAYSSYHALPDPGMNRNSQNSSYSPTDPTAYRFSAQLSPESDQPPNYGSLVKGQPSGPVYVDQKFQIASFRRDEQDPVHVPNSDSDPTPGASKHRTLDYSGSLGAGSRCVAVVPVGRNSPSDLPLKPGDVVILQNEFQEGFAQAFNQTTGLSGRIPVDSIVPLGQERYLPSL